MTPRPFRPTSYTVRHYGQSQPLQPAPAPAHHGTTQLVAAALVLLALVAALVLPVTVYEDGSATVAGWAVCLPGGICNE